MLRRAIQSRAVPRTTGTLSLSALTLLRTRLNSPLSRVLEEASNLLRTGLFKFFLVWMPTTKQQGARHFLQLVFVLVDDLVGVQWVFAAGLCCALNRAWSANGNKTSTYCTYTSSLDQTPAILHLSLFAHFPLFPSPRRLLFGYQPSSSNKVVSVPVHMYLLTRPGLT